MHITSNRLTCVPKVLVEIIEALRIWTLRRTVIFILFVFASGLDKTEFKVRNQSKGEKKLREKWRTILHQTQNPASRPSRTKLPIRRHPEEKTPTTQNPSAVKLTQNLF